MSINYEETKLSFDKYIDECRKKIENTFFKEEYLKNFKSLRNNLINQGKLPENSSLDMAVKYERLQMIDVKINHTMRVVEDVMKMSEKMGINIDFNNVLKVAALLHDIGRFDQATWNNSFSDACYKNVEGINNHAQAGYHILFKDNKIEDYNINKKYYQALGSVVYNHGNPVLKDDLAVRLENVNQLDVGLLTGSEILNENEKIIVATLVQMVRDVDMLDILYQHLTGEFPVIRPDITYDVMGDTIEKIAEYWGISPKEILEYNNITEKELMDLSSIKIPVTNVPKEKLTVPNDIKQRFFSNDDIDLREIMDRRDWTFITGMWWRLNHFLNNINFTSNLQLVYEKQLLQDIYNKYPEEYKFLVKDAFDYAQYNLVEQSLKNNESSLFVNSTKTI